MKTVLTARDVEALLRNGQAVPADALLTPSARDALRDRSTASARAARGSAAIVGGAGQALPATPVLPDAEFKWTPGSDPKTPADIQRFFTSPAIEALKVKMCDIGRRCWEREYTDGNGGNITVRVGDNIVLCTPTLISKGFMVPEDICLVDLDGKQLAGSRPRTSEANTHLGIMKRQPMAKACVHAHPVWATAFAVTGMKPPTCLIPEAEVFLGEIAVAPYRTPGTPANADTVGELGVENQSILMQNHGVICWGKDLEDAYWKMENTESYCKTVWVAMQLPGGLGTYQPGQLKELLAIRQKVTGLEDRRLNLKECELCDNAYFERDSTIVAAPSADPRTAEAERLVQTLTDQILAQLAGK